MENEKKIAELETEIKILKLELEVAHLKEKLGKYKRYYDPIIPWYPEPIYPPYNPWIYPKPTITYTDTAAYNDIKISDSTNKWISS
jgi:hypothetical protein